jgi:hypothetical protein
MKSFSQQGGIQGGLGATFPSHATFPHYAIPQGLPYHVYGYLLLLSPPAVMDGSLLKKKRKGESHACLTCIVKCHLGPWSRVNGHVSFLSCMPLPLASLTHNHKVVMRALVSSDTLTHDSSPITCALQRESTQCHTHTHTHTHTLQIERNLAVALH